jgi:hypothetical protein
MVYLVALLAILTASYAHAENVNFEDVKAGEIPKGWLAGCTGSGTPKWSVVADATAPSKGNVLKQSGEGRFPWCVRKDVSLSDGFVEVKFKPVSGKEDQAGGVIWRFKDGDNYYIARANALEDNVSLYHTEGGDRKTIKYVDAPVKKVDWNLLRVEFKGAHITVALNGKVYIDLEDTHIQNPGAVGVWTKADSVTLFDDFSYGEK